MLGVFPVGLHSELLTGGLGKALCCGAAELPLVLGELPEGEGIVLAHQLAQGAGDLEAVGAGGVRGGGDKNAGGAVQGGAIFTLADFAFAVAANSLGKMTVSVNNSISFISASKGKKLIAKATRLSNSKRLCFYNVSVTDDTGALIADMSVTGYIKDIDMPF